MEISESILNYREQGDGERAVLLCHGLFGQASNLGPVARELATDYRVITVDMRNHGRSFHSAVMTYPAMAGDLIRLMDHLQLDRADLVGHSMGGKAVMEAALMVPDRVRSLIVADIAPVAYAPHHQTVFEALAAADAPAIDRQQAESILGGHLQEAAVAMFLLMNRYRSQSGDWQWRFNLPVLQSEYAHIVAAPATANRYHGPTLFIKGDQSDYILPAHQAQTLALFPAARLKVIAGTGHWLHAEKPLLFNRIVKQTLAATPLS